MTKIEENIFLEIVGVVVWVVKMKEHLPFRREFNILCIENRVAVDRVF